MDFVEDALFNGRRFCALPVVDNYGRMCLAIRVDRSIRGGDVVAAMNRIKARHGTPPDRIQVDNESEFISKELDRWAYDHIETWRRDYNAYRPHQSLDGLSPEMYLDAHHSNRADSLLLTG